MLRSCCGHNGWAERDIRQHSLLHRWRDAAHACCMKAPGSRRLICCPFARARTPLQRVEQEKVSTSSAPFDMALRRCRIGGGGGQWGGAGERHKGALIG